MSKPSWDDAPEWAGWLCKCIDGMWEFHEYKPKPGPLYWGSTGRIVTKGCSDAGELHFNWGNSLERRP